MLLNILNIILEGIVIYYTTIIIRGGDGWHGGWRDETSQRGV
jgi:hypothetical protein